MGEYPVPNTDITVGFYNVYRATTGSSASKRAQIDRFVGSAPIMDAFCLCETDGSLTFAGYERLGFAQTLTRTFGPSQLSLALYVRDGLGFEVVSARAIGVRGQARLVIKLSLKEVAMSEVIDIYFCHANASYTGGLEAVEWADGICARRGHHVCIGDFNVNLKTTTSFMDSMSHGVTADYMITRAGNPAGTHRSKKKGSFGAYVYQALDFAVFSKDVLLVWENTDWSSYGEIDHKPIKATVDYG